MIYLIKGNEQVFIERKIEELSKQDDAETIVLDGSEKYFNVDEMLDYCSSSSLFSNKNVVIIKDPCFLIKKIDDKDSKKLMQYIGNPSYETDLILYTLEDKFSARLSLYKEFSKNSQLITLNSLDPKNFPNYVNQEINKYKLNINQNVANVLTEICSNSATVLKQNLDILSLYPESITEDVVLKMCTKKENDEVYDFINAYIDANVSKSISLLRNLVKENGDALGVIALMANQLRFMYQVSYYAKERKSDAEIAGILKCTDRRVYRTRQSLRKLSPERIMYILKELSDLELQMKSEYSVSDTDKFEMFILKNIKGNRNGSN